MQEKFDRITHQDKTFIGQALVRDTDIPVYQIVRLATAGKTIEEIVSTYPALDAEDIFQALAYALSQFVRTVLSWGHDIRVAYNSVEGFANVLLKIDSQNLTNDQRNSVETIAQSGKSLRGSWQSQSIWAYFFAPNSEHVRQQKFSIEEELKKRWRDEIGYFHEKKGTHISGDVPPVIANQFLGEALCLLTDRTSFAKEDENFIPRVRLTLSDKDTVLVQINRGIEIRDIQFGAFRFLLDFVASVLHEHGSVLEIELGEEGTVFSFTLPVWHDDSPES